MTANRRAQRLPGPTKRDRPLQRQDQTEIQEQKRRRGAGETPGLLIAVWHVADYYGQVVYYLRLNGIVPPPTQQHGLQVR